MTENTRPTIEERYSSATNTSDLTMDVQAQGVRPAGMMIAAGWSRSKLGVALLRLQSEWDGSEKPRPLSAAALKTLARTFARDAADDGKVLFRDWHGRVARVTTIDAAKRQAHEWHVHELGLLFQKLKTLGEVRVLMAEFAWLVKIDDPHTKAAGVVSWWLHHTCPACNGGRWELIPGTNRHSSRACGECKGSGDAPIPFGMIGRRLLGELEEAINEARSSMGSATSNRVA